MRPSNQSEPGDRADLQSIDDCLEALAANPDDIEALAAAAGIASRLDMPERALQLWRRALAIDPSRLDAVDGCAKALRDLHQYADAIDVLRAAIAHEPREPKLWNTLGTVTNQSGDSASALIFFSEAIRLDERCTAAIYNRGAVHLDMGEFSACEADFAWARAVVSEPSERAMIDFAAATLLLCQGRLEEGWEAYEVRFNPDYAGAVAFDIAGERWQQDRALAARRLLVVAEQGLGDEIMFAGMLPDLIETLGPDGQLSIAVDPRLVSLFARSFPGAEVTAHATRRTPHAPPVRSAPGARGRQLWTPLGSLTRLLRRKLNDFPKRGGYLVPDAAAKERWRVWLGDGPPTVGLTWRSGSLAGERRRQFPALQDWVPVLSVPGVRFVNLQYGATCDELAALAALAGRPVLHAPGLDLHDDLEGLAALTSSLDGVVGVPNATTALAAACGAKTCFLGAKTSWPRLGTDGYPWYPQAAGFACAGHGDWAEAMAKAAAVIKAL